jgi:hypothetical protein
MFDSDDLSWPKINHRRRRTRRKRVGRDSYIKHFQKFKKRLKLGRQNCRKRRRRLNRKAALHAKNVKQKLSNSIPSVLQSAPAVTGSPINQDKNGETENININKGNSNVSKTKQIKNINHYNKLNGYDKEFCVGFFNAKAAVTLDNGRLFELAAECDDDNIGLLGIIEHHELFSDVEIRDTPLDKGWHWMRTSAEKGPSGKANVGGIGFLVSYNFYDALKEITKVSPRIIDIIFSIKRNTSAFDMHIINNYGPPATKAHVENAKSHFETLADYINKIS